jgi:hypothetical protein
MEANLQFNITLVDGTRVEQNMGVPPDKIEALIQQVFAQYSQVGVLKKEGNKFSFIPAPQIRLVEIEIPTILTAVPGDAERAAAAAGKLKSIIT